MLSVFYCNGFMVKRTDSEHSMKYGKYHGIEGDAWPIDSYSDIKERSHAIYIRDYMERNVFQSIHDDDYVDLCNDIDFINIYIKTCLSLNYGIDVLLCETEKPHPQLSLSCKNKDNFLFLGYDYAFREPSYYSCVYQDIFRFSEMSELKLNKHELFNDIESIKMFIKIRNELVEKYPPNEFESGEFIIYKIWRYIGEYPMNI